MSKNSTASTCLARPHPIWVYIISVAALIVLPLAVWMAVSAWQEKIAARQLLADVQARENARAGLNERINSFEDYVSGVDAVLRQAKVQRLSPSRWEKRRIDVDGRAMSREEAVDFLAGAGSGSGYFFVPEMFALHVVQKGDGLYRYRKGDMNRLRLTLKGTYLMRSAE